MPVEDIEHLREIGTRQTFQILVDSKERDKQAYPTPSEYVVQFSQSFNNVIGMDVIEAQVPRTMYNVDEHNNTLSFFIHTNDFDMNALAPNLFTTTTIDPGDYTLQTLIPQINNAFVAHLNGSNADVTANIYASALSDPPDRKNILKFDCAYPFIFDMEASTLAETLGFDELARTTPILAASNYAAFSVSRGSGWTNSNIIQLGDGIRRKEALAGLVQTVALQLCNVSLSALNASGASTIVPIGGATSNNGAATTSITYYTYPSAIAQVNAWANQISYFATNNRLFHSLDYPASSGRQQTLFEGPRGVVRTMPLSASQWVAQRFYTNQATSLTAVAAAFKANSLSATLQVDWRIYEGTEVRPGTLVYDTFTSANNGITDAIVVDYVDGTLSVSKTLAPKTISLKKSTYYWIEFYVSPISVAVATTESLAIYYNDAIAQGGSLLSTQNGGLTYDSKDANDIAYQATIKLTTTDEYHRIVSPGLVSLVGHRYCILRCKEIEEHSHRSLAYTTHTMGIARFNLDTIGFGNMTISQNSYKQREFHPIGKLSRISLRFETRDGKLYNFKGVNHGLTLAVHYLEPTAQQRAMHYPLNANYKPNFMEYRYLMEDQDQEADEVGTDAAADDYADDDDDDRPLTYREVERKYAPQFYEKYDYRRF